MTTLLNLCAQSRWYEATSTWYRWFRFRGIFILFEWKKKDFCFLLSLSWCCSGWSFPLSLHFPLDMWTMFTFSSRNIYTNVIVAPLHLCLYLFPLIIYHSNDGCKNFMFFYFFYPFLQINNLPSFKRVTSNNVFM